MGGEAYEDSDDGDDEGQEVDYMSDASSDFDEVVKGRYLIAQQSVY